MLSLAWGVHVSLDDSVTWSRFRAMALDVVAKFHFSVRGTWTGCAGAASTGFWALGPKR